MKKYLLFLLAGTLLFGLYSCGGLRTSSINTRDDINIQHNQLGLESHNIVTQRQQFELDRDKQTFAIETGSSDDIIPPSKQESSGWQQGIIINRYEQRQIEFQILNGAHLVRRQILTPKQNLFVRLPIGEYRLLYFEYTNQGRFLMSTDVLAVTNESNAFFNGKKLHFVITN